MAAKYRAANAVKIGRIASEDVTLHVVKNRHICAIKRSS